MRDGNDYESVIVIISLLQCWIDDEQSVRDHLPSDMSMFDEIWMGDGRTGNDSCHQSALFASSVLPTKIRHFSRTRKKPQKTQSIVERLKVIAIASVLADFSSKLRQKKPTKKDLTRAQQKRSPVFRRARRRVGNCLTNCNPIEIITQINDRTRASLASTPPISSQSAKFVTKNFVCSIQHLPTRKRDTAEKINEKLDGLTLISHSKGKHKKKSCELFRNAKQKPRRSFRSVAGKNATHPTNRTRQNSRHHKCIRHWQRPNSQHTTGTVLNPPATTLSFFFSLFRARFFFLPLLTVLVPHFKFKLKIKREWNRKRQRAGSHRIATLTSYGRHTHKHRQIHAKHDHRRPANNWKLRWRHDDDAHKTER